MISSQLNRYTLFCNHIEINLFCNIKKKSYFQKILRHYFYIIFYFEAEMDDEIKERFIQC